jgi:hypothetical protein
MKPFDGFDIFLLIISSAGAVATVVFAIVAARLMTK